MATSDMPRDGGCDPRRLVPLALWSGLGLIAVVLLSRSASGTFTRQVPPVVSCLLGLVSIALSVSAWWYDERLAADRFVVEGGDPARPPSAPRQKSPYDRSVRGLASLIAPLTIGMATAGGASSAIGVLLALGLCSAAVVLAVSWESDPGQTVREIPKVSQPVPDVEVPSPVREPASHVAGDSSLEIESETASVFSDPDVSQQVIRRTTPDNLDCIEALLRVAFAAGEREAVVHLPIYPPFAAAPEVECEPLEADDVAFKVTTAQPYGVRIEVRRQADYDEARTLAVGVALHARHGAEAAA